MEGGGADQGCCLLASPSLSPGDAAGQPPTRPIDHPKATHRSGRVVRELAQHLQDGCHLQPIENPRGGPAAWVV